MQTEAQTTYAQNNPRQLRLGAPRKSIVGFEFVFLGYFFAFYVPISSFAKVTPLIT
jgi:hypothetical protein